MFAVYICHARNQDWNGEFNFQPRMHLEFGVKEQVVFIGNFTINCECWSKLINTGQEYTEEPRASKPIASFVAVVKCFIALKFPCPSCVIIVTCSCCKWTKSFIMSWTRYPYYRGCFDAQGFLQRRKRLLQLALLFPVCNHAQTRGHNREKSLRHVVMVAKFLDDNKPKIYLKSKFALFQTSSMLSNFI